MRVMMLVTNSSCVMVNPPFLRKYYHIFILNSNLENKIIYDTVTKTTSNDCLTGISKAGFIPIFAYVISPTTSAQRNVVIQYNPYNKNFYANCVGLASTDVTLGVVYYKA